MSSTVNYRGLSGANHKKQMLVRNQEICALYSKGNVSLRDLATQYGLVHERIRQILTENGVAMNAHGVPLKHKQQAEKPNE